MHEMRKTDTRSAIGTREPSFASVAVMSEGPQGFVKNRSETRELRYHANCEPIFPHIRRAGVMVSPDGWRVFLRIKTTDEGPDVEMIELVAKETGLRVCSEPRTSQGGVIVTLQAVAAADDQVFYEISMSGTNVNEIRRAMKSVDKTGLEILAAKEMTQNIMSTDIAHLESQLITESPQSRRRGPEAVMSALDILDQMDLDARVFPGPECAR